MDEALKRRLVGAAVIMSLIVIFIPMLVDEEPVMREELGESNIPAEPDPIEPREYRTEHVVSVEEGAQAAASTDAPAGDEVPPMGEMPVVNEEVAPLTGDDTAPEGEDPAESPAANAVAANGDAGTAADEPREELQAWVVQVASFTNPKFAQNLVDDLRDKGFAAFKEQVQSGGRGWYRVVVGPEADKQRTRDIQNAVVKATGDEKLRGAIKAYP